MKRSIVFLVMLVARTGAAAPSNGEYRLINTVPIPGNGSYDYLYLDAAGRRLYVTHGDEVAVIDPDAVAVAGQIRGLAGVHGVNVVRDLQKGFITNGKSNVVTIFDPKKLSSVGEVKSTGKGPDALTYDPSSRRVFVFNHADGNVTVINPADGTVSNTIAVGGKLEFGQADGKGHVWVNVEDKSEVVLIDSKKMAVAAHWPLAPCEEPTGMALDTENRRLFVGCGNQKMAVMDADHGKVVTTLPIGPRVDATDFDPGTKDIFNSCGGDGTMVVIRQDGPDKYRVAQTVKTEPGAKTLTVDPKTHRVFLSVASRDENRKTKEGTFRVLVFGNEKAAP